ncbi:ATP-binding protein [Aquirhabdus parva]|nr:ATP-binding protein [Aquirhabdus parva]
MSNMMTNTGKAGSNNAADIYSLALHIPPFSPTDTVNDVAAQFMQPDYQVILSAPIVHDGIPVGVITRYQLHNIFMKNFGRELFGRKPIAEFMQKNFLVVDVHMPVADAASYISANIQQPLSEDFVITEQGRYLGLGSVIALLGAMERQVTQNAHELSNAYRELKSSQAQLVQSEKMASLGQMVAGVAHEINTPLGYVKNNVEIVQEFIEQLRQMNGMHQDLVGVILSPEGNDVAIAEKLAELDDLQSMIQPELLFEDMLAIFNDTNYGLEQINELVLGLKNFSRLDQAMTDSVSLNDCVNSSLLIAKNTLKNGIQVIKQFGDLPKISCAPSQINQVLLNLLTNAAQAMNGNGKILIKTWSDESNVYISVQDTGKGMPPEVLAKIFDPFYTTKPVGEGTGLGLSISYQIIEQHGGRIRVASEVGRGTRFGITLPRKQKAVPVIQAVLAEV